MKSNGNYASITGTITPHRGRGTTLGVPTLNFPAPANIPDGIYAGYCLNKQQRWPAAIFVGAAVTFAETERQVEVHILDQSIHITGTISVELITFIRSNQRFEQVDDLKKQMTQDLKQIRQCLLESLPNN